jgi:hypothetical protein
MTLTLEEWSQGKSAKFRPELFNFSGDWGCRDHVIKDGQLRH